MTASTLEPNRNDLTSPEDDYDFSDFSPIVQGDREADLDEDTSNDLDGEEDYSTLSEESDEDDFVDPRTHRTKVGLTANPIAKFAVVSAATFIVVIIAGIITNGISSTKLVEQAKPTVAKSPTTEQDEAFPQAAAASNEAALKTELAFAQQTEANQTLARQSAPSPTPSLTPSPSPQTVRPAQAVSTVPTPAAAPRVISPAAPLPVPAIPVAQNPPPQLSPMEQWQASAQIGSFGSVTIRPTPIAPPRPAAPVAVPPPSTPVAIALPSTAPPTPRSAPGTPISQLRSTSSIPGLRNQPLVPVLVGTMASGQLQTEVLMTGDASPPAANLNDPTTPKYLINVDTPLKDSTGNTAIPEGSTLVAVVRGFSAQSGGLQLDVISVIANSKEYTVTPGVLAIRSDDGGMLVADQIRRGNNFLDRVALPVFAGLAEAGQVLSEPSGTTTTRGGSTTTTNLGDRDPGAAFVSGAFGNLSDQLSQEAERRNDRQSESETSTWRLRAGESVQIFVNSSFEM
jgi:hypothetical protein